MVQKYLLGATFAVMIFVLLLAGARSGFLNDISETGATALSDSTIATTTAINSTVSSSTQGVIAEGTYLMAQVAAHNNAKSCWTVINGGVYDVTSWINQHPGGPQAILSLCGKDGSALFIMQHSGDTRPQQELATFYIGKLSQ